METQANKRQQHGNGGDNQTLTNKRRRRSDLPAAAAAAGSRWLLLNSRIDGEGGDSAVADAKTTAACCTSSGKPFSISLGVAAPPACCSLHFDWLGGGGVKHKHPKPEPKDVRVIAGHDDAILIEMWAPSPQVVDDDYYLYLYEAGGGARPPSLSLLPACNVPVQVGYRRHRDPTPQFRHLGMENTGVLRRRGGDLVVCQYEMTCDPPIYDMAELCMLRVGAGRDPDPKWIAKRVPIVEHREGSSELQPWRRRSHSLVAAAAVPVGNRFMCWVDYSTGFIVCDMEAEEEIPKLRFVPLPATDPHDDGYCGHYPLKTQAFCTLGAAGPDAVRFVSVSPPRCCFGDFPGQTSCQCSSSSFNVITWTVALSMEEATTWVKNVVLDCDEICKWPLPNYGCLPRDKNLEYPMVSSEDPDVVYFKVEGMAVAINTRSKNLLSVVVPGDGTCTDQDEDEEPPHHRLVTAKLSW